ncbi:thioredoxin family protein [Oligoflexus tunisiensis]|uniref:thioredoxin family protein n=1 Tax=Oligoflexus tunisiensis TaxID=708132 RepID=UPI001FDF928F|nr:thioredoxin family protein [Oligoflexus tunisiensis]
MNGIETFRSKIMEAKGSFLVDFWGPSCAPCLDLNRALEALEDGYRGTLTFVKINADEEIDIATEFGVRGLPTLILIHDGQIMERWIGAKSLTSLKSKLDKALGAIPSA